MREPGYIPVRSRGGRRKGGFTLIELLVVLAIISLMAGLSIGAFREARRNYGLAASAGEIQSIFRRARNQSISNGTGSFVVVDPTSSSIWAQSFETMGEWSFEGAGAEDEGVAGYGEPRMVGGEYIDGRLGQGVSFRGAGGYVDCGYQASFDLSTGVVLEAWVRHNRRPALRQAFKSETTSGRRSLRGKSTGAGGGGLAPAYSIVEKQDSWFLGMTPEGALEGHIGDFQVITEDDVVPSGRWVFVSLRYDGVSLVLASDGVERRSDVLQGLGRKLGDRAAPVVPAAIPRNENPVMISAKANSFPGDIDEVRLRGRSEKAIYSHPPFEKMIGWKKVIHFDRYGHLDPVFHEKNIRIVLVEVSDDHFARQEALAEKKKSSRAQTDRFGLTFQEWLEDEWPPDEMPDLVEEEEERDIEERVYSQARKKIIKIDTLGVVSVQ